MQTALRASDAPGQPLVKPQASPKKVSPSPEPQKKVISESAGSPQIKQSMPTVSQNKDEVAKGQDGQKQSSPSPGQKTPQDSRKTTGPQKPPDQTNQTGRKQSTQQESGGFFGFGGSKAQPDAKPEESVTGKMFGFGSSIFNSASTLITTPPVSPKMAAAKDTKQPVVQKPEQEKKLEQTQQTMASPSVQAKVDKAPSEPPKAAASQAAPNAGQSTCPLCKLGLNMGSKDPPNYNTCTECKNTVCNQCGFNPMPAKSEVGQHVYQSFLFVADFSLTIA